MTKAFQYITDLLNNYSKPHEIISHKIFSSFEDIKAQNEIQIDSLIKTLVYKDENQNWYFIVLKIDDKINFQELTRFLCLSRSALKMASATEIETILGSQIGGISPIPILPNIKVIFDKSIIDLKTVYCGIGQLESTLKIDVIHLLDICKPQIANICK